MGEKNVLQDWIVFQHTTIFCRGAKRPRLAKTFSPFTSTLANPKRKVTQMQIFNIGATSVCQLTILSTASSILCYVNVIKPPFSVINVGAK